MPLAVVAAWLRFGGAIAACVAAGMGWAAVCRAGGAAVTHATHQCGAVGRHNRQSGRQCRQEQRGQTGQRAASMTDVHFQLYSSGYC